MPVVRFSASVSPYQRPLSRCSIEDRSKALAPLSLFFFLTRTSCCFICRSGLFVFFQSFENWQAIFPGGNIVVRFFEARLKTAFISAREFREMFVETAIVETACSEIIGDQQFFESGRRRRQNLLSSASLGETAGGEKTRLEGDDEQERARASERAARGNLRTRHRRREHKRRERPTTFFFGFLFFHRLLLLSFFFISFISFHIIWVLSL